MTCPRINRLRMTRGWPIAAAAFEHFAGNPDLRLAGIVALIFPAAARVSGIKRSGAGKARVALARKLSVILDSIWRSGQPTRWSEHASARN
jgi:hypothetical protein